MQQNYLKQCILTSTIFKETVAEQMHTTFLLSYSISGSKNPTLHMNYIKVYPIRIKKKKEQSLEINHRYFKSSHCLTPGSSTNYFLTLKKFELTKPAGLRQMTAMLSLYCSFNTG